jgi:hypothetical protein
MVRLPTLADTYSKAHRTLRRYRISGSCRSHITESVVERNHDGLHPHPPREPGKTQAPRSASTSPRSNARQTSRPQTRCPAHLFESPRSAKDIEHLPGEMWIRRLEQLAYHSRDASILACGPLPPRTRLPFRFRRPEGPSDTRRQSTSARPRGLQALGSSSAWCVFSPIVTILARPLFASPVWCGPIRPVSANPVVIQRSLQARE